MTTPATTLNKSALEVKRVLESYADRGVFRGFGWSATGTGAHFTFRWHAPETMQLRFREPAAVSKRGTSHRGASLDLPGLLPAVPFRSAMDRSFRAFLADRQDENLPEHRRIDPSRATLKARNRGGTLGIELVSLDGDLSYLTRKTVALINEVFHSFLTGPYESYMVEYFGVPEE